MDKKSQPPPPDESGQPKPSQSQPNFCLTCDEKTQPFNPETGGFDQAQNLDQVDLQNLQEWTPDLVRADGKPLVQEDATMVFVGKRRTGKSTFFQWVMHYLKQNFPTVLVMTKTKFNQFFQKHIPDEYVHDGVDPMLIENIKQRQVKLVKAQQAYERGELADPPPDARTCLVFDDCACDKKAMRYQDQLDELFFNGRHFKLFIAITLQYVKAVPPGIRDNADWVVCFKLKGERSRNAVYESWASDLPKREFYAMLDRVSVGFQALVINTDPMAEPNQRFFKATADPDLGADEPWGSAEMRENSSQPKQA